jgi:hypothetical protein
MQLVPLRTGQYAHPIHGRPPRSSTSYLSKDIIANYTFFTFVRDPNTRFRSSYEQAICRERWGAVQVCVVLLQVQASSATRCSMETDELVLTS